MVVLPGTAEVSTTNTELWARCEWQLRSPVLEHDQFAGHLAKPLRLGGSHFQLLTAMTNVISTEAAFTSSPGAAILHDSFAVAVASAILDAVDTTTLLSPPQAAIVERARGVIDVRHTDPAFGVAALASEVAVSQYYLNRLFALLGTTSRRALEARRVQTARLLLHLAPEHSHGAMLEAARRSGFRTVRTMRAALDRHSEASAPAAPRTY